jgi:hypothetical protein
MRQRIFYTTQKRFMSKWYAGALLLAGLVFGVILLAWTVNALAQYFNRPIGQDTVATELRAYALSIVFQKRLTFVHASQTPIGKPRI